MVQTNYQVKYTLAPSIHRQQKYVHPKGAPDADLIFGSSSSASGPATSATSQPGANTNMTSSSNYCNNKKPNTNQGVGSGNYSRLTK